MHEIASGSAYEGRRDLGNIYPGDGRKFRGHGPIQLTGHLNHQSFFDYIGRPELIDTPEILETDLQLAWDASGWFWTVYKNLNKYADRDDVDAVTLRVNGGYNGLADRKQYLLRAKEILK
jgi:putative chitinase